MRSLRLMSRSPRRPYHPRVKFSGSSQSLVNAQSSSGPAAVSPRKLFRSGTYKTRSMLFSMEAKMPRSILLTDREATLRQLLLDVSTYIGTLETQTKPTLRFTGGWVRDKLLGSTSVDVDIGIDNMTGFQFGNLMKQFLAEPETKNKYNQDVLGGLAKIEANPEKSKHLETVTTRILGFDIDLVNLRKETYVENSRNPTMEFGTPEEDALRRDATVNALFYNLSTSDVEDFTSRGLHDMEQKLIKTPLAPLQTFKDDPLRLLRAIRFASRLGFEIANEDETAMSDESIKESLRQKISRERVGVELTKMLKGPNPTMALHKIDTIGLYNVVFTNPTDADCNVVDTAHWSRTYKRLQALIEARSDSSLISNLQTISQILLRNSDDIFLAWMLVCLIPWAKEPPKPSKKATSRPPPSPASIAAREGIKADNKICKVIDDAARDLQEITMLKDSINDDTQLATASKKRKQGMHDRVLHGQAIRRWGSHWRSSVIYALLNQIIEVETSTDSKILDSYVTWLSYLQEQDLLNVNQWKPIVDGNQLSKALDIKTGPWMKKALDIAMEWQLRNPDQHTADGAIAEVLERKHELGVP